MSCQKDCYGIVLQTWVVRRKSKLAVLVVQINVPSRLSVAFAELHHNKSDPVSPVIEDVIDIGGGSNS